MGRLGIAVAVVAAPSIVFAAAATVLLLARPSPAVPLAPMAEVTPPAGVPCATPRLAVVTEDLSSAHHDLCAAFHRATDRVSLGKLRRDTALHIRLEPIAVHDVDVVGCAMRIDATVPARHLTGRATVRFAPDERALATNDCIDALLEDLLTKLTK